MYFVGRTMNLTDEGMKILVHEMGHVWQYQNGGLAYILSSLLAQLAGLIATGSRRSAYDWRKAHNARRPWHDWNAEQQAECISHYHQALCRGDQETVRITLPYIAHVRCRDGALEGKR